MARSRLGSHIHHAPAPRNIQLLGADGFDGLLDEVVGGERFGQHALGHASLLQNWLLVELHGRGGAGDGGLGLRGGSKGSVEPGNITVLEPIELLGVDCLEAVLCLGPSAPTGVLQAGRVVVRLAPANNISPAGGDLGLGPVVRKVVDVDGGLVVQGAVVIGLEG